MVKDYETPIAVREANDSDIEAVQRIYTPYVLNGLATFEEIPPDLEELLSRKEAIKRAGLPYLVAESNQQIFGYAYANAYRPRPAYRYTVEDSVYVAEGFHSRGIGRALLSALIEHCEAGDWRQMIAVIGNSSNFGSIALHRRLGFQPVGTLKAVGFKLGRWVDTVLMQRVLGPGDGILPH